ncbi:hypothetical protein sync_0803 [Synechococcus sp. CC9311]|nr:hypothetical protein sync_0803 [Synechococcus sp. CC9311]
MICFGILRPVVFRTGLDRPSSLRLLESPLISRLWWFRLASPANTLPSQAMFSSAFAYSNGACLCAVMVG